MRLKRRHAPTSAEGRDLAAKVSRRLSQVAAAPAPAVELLASTHLNGKAVSVEVWRESKGQLLDPGCYAEVIVHEGTIRTAVRLPGSERLFEQGVLVASVFDLLGDRAAEAAERMTAVSSVLSFPLELTVSEVKGLDEVNLILEEPGPAPEILVGGVINARIRIFLGAAHPTSGRQETGGSG